MHNLKGHSSKAKIRELLLATLVVCGLLCLARVSLAGDIRIDSRLNQDITVLVDPYAQGAAPGIHMDTDPQRDLDISVVPQPPANATTPAAQSLTISPEIHTSGY